MILLCYILFELNKLHSNYETIADIHKKVEQDSCSLKRHSMAKNRCCQNKNKHIFLDDLNAS